MNHAFADFAYGAHPSPESDPKATVLDVRSPAEYQAGHIPGARLLPVDELNASSLADIIDHAESGRQPDLPDLPCRPAG